MDIISAFIIVVLVGVIIYYLVWCADNLGDCNQDCNQGRNCDCERKNE